MSDIRIDGDISAGIFADQLKDDVTYGQSRGFIPSNGTILLDFLFSDPRQNGPPFQTTRSLFRRPYIRATSAPLTGYVDLKSEGADKPLLVRWEYRPSILTHAESLSHTELASQNASDGDRVAIHDKGNLKPATVQSQRSEELSAAVPTPDDANIAKAASGKLVNSLPAAQEFRLQVVTVEGTESLALPVSVVRLLASALAEMGQGNSVALTPIPSHLTIQQSAERLNVSESFLVGLLDKGLIPYRGTGRDRMITSHDLISYKLSSDADRQKIFDELVAQAQDLDMGY